VRGALGIVENAGVSESLVGLTVLALGTSAPELVATASAIYRGKTDVAVGNIIGSNIFNLLWVLGAVRTQSIAGKAGAFWPYTGPTSPFWSIAGEEDADPVRVRHPPRIAGPSSTLTTMKTRISGWRSRSARAPRSKAAISAKGLSTHGRIQFVREDRASPRYRVRPSREATESFSSCEIHYEAERRRRTRQSRSWRGDAAGQASPPWRDPVLPRTEFRAQSPGRAGERVRSCATRARAFDRSLPRAQS